MLRKTNTRNSKSRNDLRWCSLSVILIAILLGFSCSKENNFASSGYRTERVVILVMDGARYSETWGDSSKQYIPRLAERATHGVINTAFENQGVTRTIAGHTAMTTGVYQSINNGGYAFPDNPSIFQYWLKETGSDSESAWVIASKDKIEAITDCLDQDWTGHYRPTSDCGINGEGLGSGYRNDSLTYSRAKELLTEYHSKLVLISFREPDYSAHAGSWQGYLDGIQATDEYIQGMCEFIENDSNYANTTIFVTNDHGRHLDDVGSGFSSHGDDCQGCKHLLFYAQGPDFKKGVILNHPRSLVDIAATVAHLLELDMPHSTGEVMYELFD